MTTISTTTTRTGKSIVIGQGDKGLVAIIDGSDPIAIGVPSKLGTDDVCRINSGPLTGKFIAISSGQARTIKEAIGYYINARAAARYDDLNNEGGEGYNPHRTTDVCAGDKTDYHKGDNQ